MTKDEALDLAIRSLQRNMDEILFLQGNNAVTYPQLNMFNEAILQLHELKGKKEDNSDALETVKSVAWDWCYEHDYMSGYNPDFYAKIQKVREAINVLGGYKAKTKEEVGHNAVSP